MLLDFQKDLSVKNKKAPSCIHTKNIYSLIDLPQKEESFKQLSKHLESCSQCAQELSLFKLKSKAAEIYIPKVVMDRDLRQSFEREVGELFKVMNLNDREALKRNVKKGFHIIDSIGVSFLKNLTSKAMIKAYFMGAIIIISLKLFL